MDPVLIALALLAVPSFLGALRQRSAEAVLLLSWLAVPLAAVLMWKYRNEMEQFVDWAEARRRNQRRRVHV